MVFLFPFSEVEKNSSIILYGAGYIGYDFYRQIQLSHYCHLVKWVDRQYKWYRSLGMPVESPDEISQGAYDAIIIAVKEEKTYQSIRNWLHGHGVEEERIIWRTDNEWQCDIAQKYDEERVKKESEEAVLVDPHRFLTPKRIDLVIRRNYAEDILNGRRGTESERQYEALIRALDNEEEPVYDYVMAYFTEYNFKKGVKQFKKAFKELIFSMQEHGFLKEKFIPVDINGEPINGAHRIAAALALGLDVWARKYNFEGFHFDFRNKYDL